MLTKKTGYKSLPFRFWITRAPGPALRHFEALFGFMTCYTQQKNYCELLFYDNSVNKDTIVQEI